MKKSPNWGIYLAPWCALYFRGCVEKRLTMHTSHRMAGPPGLAGLFPFVPSSVASDIYVVPVPCSLEAFISLQPPASLSVVSPTPPCPSSPSRHMSPPPARVNPLTLGPPVAQERGCAVADGDIDPITGKAFSEMGGEGVGDGSSSSSAKSEYFYASFLPSGRCGGIC